MHKVWILVLVVLVAVIAAACSSDDDKKDEDKPAYPTVSVTDAYNRPAEAILIDVREQSEWAGGHPVGSILVPLSTFDQLAPTVLTDKNAEIYVICNSGNRSRDAAQRLIDLGYTHVYNVDGGYQAWFRASYPTTLE
jgi:rhodanese-related sulfurtransferase